MNQNKHYKIVCSIAISDMILAVYKADSQITVRPRFFDQVGHETMYASSGNKHFFTKSCHRQTYQNYEQS